jgi:tetratricopeptide (TPR) repeat protein
MKKQSINSLNTAPGNHQYLIVLGIILFLTYIAYLPSLKNEFTNWDDPNYVYKNPTIQQINGDNIKKLMRDPHMGNYHPITMLSLAMDFSLGKLNPKTYHTTNLILHIANTGLVFFFILLLFGKIEIAAICSLLFGIHTLHVESVAWISERKDVLYTLFFLSALIFYIKYLKEDKRVFYFLSILLFILSNLSKGMAVSLSLVVILIDYLRGRNLFDKKVILEKIPFLVLSLVFGSIAIYSQRLGPDTEGIPDYNLFNRLIFASYGFLQYIFKLIVPFNLSAFYPYPEKGSLPLIYLMSPVFILVIAALVIYSAKKYREFIFCFLFFFFNILLVLQILPVGKAIMADRYAYIPSIGFFLFIGIVYDKISSFDISYKKISMLFLSLYALMILLFTYERCKVWHDSLTLWTDVIEKFDNEQIAYNNRGVAYADMGDYTNAISDYDKSISLNLKDSKAYNNKGVVLSNLKKYKEAKENYDKAIEISSNYPDAYYNRANVFINLNDPQNAIKDYDKVIRLNPYHSGALNNRGLAKRIVKDYEGALKDFNVVIKLYPQNAEAYSNRSLTRFDIKDFKGAEEDNKKALELNPGSKVGLQEGNMKVIQNDFQGAIIEYTYVIDQDPDNLDAYLKRGVCKININDLKGAMSDLSYVIDSRPNDFEAYFQRGIVKNTTGDYKGSIEDYDKAIEIKPDYAEVYCNRGISKYGMKDLKGAMKDYNKAIELNPKFVEAYSNRGLLKSNTKDFKGALEDYNKCIELNPSFALAFNNRGVLYFNMGNKKEACEDWKKGAGLGDLNSKNFLGRFCK